MTDLKQGFKNITEPTIFNLLIIITLGLIVYLVYQDTKRISLFTDITAADTMAYLDNILVKYGKKQEQANELTKLLNDQQKLIDQNKNTLSQLIK